MAVPEERLEQLERSLHLAGNALQAANNRIASLESAAGTSTAAASMVDMRVLGKPSIFAGDEASWKSWSFVMLSFSAAVSPELRALMEKARTNVADMLNVKLTAAEAGVEQTAVLHAQSEYERRGAEETAERARGRGCRVVEGVL